MHNSSIRPPYMYSVLLRLENTLIIRPPNRVATLSLFKRGEGRFRD